MEKGTKLSLTIEDDTFNFTSPHKFRDSDTLVQAFAGLMLAHTYNLDTIIDSMRKYVLDNKINCNINNESED